MLEELCKRIKHCCTTLRRSWNQKCCELLVQKFDWSQTLRNNMKQGVQTQHVTSNNVAPVCSELNSRKVIYDIAVLIISLTTSFYHTIITPRGHGVLITCDARFNEHIYVQVNKANKMLGFIRRSLSSRSDQFLPTFRSLYVALVRSHLIEYASEIWSPKSY